MYTTKNIINKIKKAKLVGRGGGCYPTDLKWESVKNTKSDKKYVICNASEGEPGVEKDYYLLKNHAEKIMDGLKIAIDTMGAEKAFLYLNPKYHKELAKKLKEISRRYPIEIYKKNYTAGYVGGEETSAINCIEGKRVEPRLRPPYPPTSGLWNKPTLINNVETLYNVALVVSGEYDYKRFYTVNGDCLWTGVYEFPENYTIERVLKETKNYPKFKFFIQVGGDASGEVLNSKQLKRPAEGSASITIYSVSKHEPLVLIKKWINFFYRESCGQCTPCREGVLRLKEMLNKKEPDWEKFSAILNNLSETSFCGLGCAVPIAIKSYVENILVDIPENKINLPKGSKKFICECFK